MTSDLLADCVVVRFLMPTYLYSLKRLHSKFCWLITKWWQVYVKAYKSAPGSMRYSYMMAGFVLYLIAPRVHDNSAFQTKYVRLLPKRTATTAAAATTTTFMLNSHLTLTSCKHEYVYQRDNVVVYLYYVCRWICCNTTFCSDWTTRIGATGLWLWVQLVFSPSLTALTTCTSLTSSQVYSLLCNGAIHCANWMFNFCEVFTYFLICMSLASLYAYVISFLTTPHIVTIWIKTEL